MEKAMEAEAAEGYIEIGDVVSSTTMTGEFVVVAKDGDMTWLRDMEALDLYTTTPEKLLTKIERKFEVGKKYHSSDGTCFQVIEVNDRTVLMKYDTEGTVFAAHDWVENVHYYTPCDEDDR